MDRVPSFPVYIWFSNRYTPGGWERPIKPKKAVPKTKTTKKSTGDRKPTESEEFSSRLRYGIIIIVTIVWAVNFLARFTSDNVSSDSINGIFMTIVGGIYLTEQYKAKQNKNSTADTGPEPVEVEAEMMDQFLAWQKEQREKEELADYKRLMRKRMEEDRDD